MNNQGLTDKLRLKIHRRRWLAAVFPCLIIIGSVLAVLPLLKSSAATYIKDECPWADPPTVWGHVFLDATPLDGVNVGVINQTKTVVYNPYGPDPSCQMKIPETQSHLCCFHLDGTWESFWEDAQGGDSRRPLSPGDIIVARATHNAQTQTVAATYNGRPNFQMPDIKFISENQSGLK